MTNILAVCFFKKNYNLQQPCHGHFNVIRTPAFIRTCYMLYVICYMLYVICYMSHIEETLAVVLSTQIYGCKTWVRYLSTLRKAHGCLLNGMHGLTANPTNISIIITNENVETKCPLFA